MSFRIVLCIVVPSLVLVLGAACCRPLPGGKALGPRPNTWYVATDGNDAWSGTLPAPSRDHADGPFATLPRARDELRRRRAAGGLPTGATVLVRKGTYFLAEPLVLAPSVSGSSSTRASARSSLAPQTSTPSTRAAAGSPT